MCNLYYITMLLSVDGLELEIEEEKVSLFMMLTSFSDPDLT